MGASVGDTGQYSQEKEGEGVVVVGVCVTKTRMLCRLQKLPSVGDSVGACVGATGGSNKGFNASTAQVNVLLYSHS